MARSYSYATIPDIRAHLSFVGTFTANTKPNATQVHSFIETAADELDSALGQADYVVPVATGATVAHSVLRTWSAIGAAMYTAAAMPQGQDSKHLQFLERRWNALLTGIREGDITLAAGKSTALSSARYPDGSALYPYGATPYFSRHDPYSQ